MRAIVTGAASGIGAATAAYFEERHGLVARLDLAPIDSPLSFQCDVTDEDSIRTAIDSAAAALGGVDAVVANAGITARGNVEETPLEVWEHVFAVNARGVFLTARAAIPHLRRTQGALVTVASQVVFVAQPRFAAYAASKGAVVALTGVMAQDYAREGVRINAICPGTTLTPMNQSLWDQTNDPAGARSAAEAGQAHGRLIDPREIAAAIYFLCGTDCGSMIGSTLLVDGGVAHS